MIILRSTHEKLLKAERERSDVVISVLREQIADLRRLVFVPEPTPSQEHPIRVANAVLDGQEVIPTVDPKQEEADLAEANRILSGAYDRIEETW